MRLEKFQSFCTSPPSQDSPNVIGKHSERIISDTGVIPVSIEHYKTQDGKRSIPVFRLAGMAARMTLHRGRVSRMV